MGHASCGGKGDCNNNNNNPAAPPLHHLMWLCWSANSLHFLFCCFCFSLFTSSEKRSRHCTCNDFFSFFWKSDLHIANSRTFTISWFRIYFYYYFGADTFEMSPYICRNGHLIFFFKYSTQFSSEKWKKNSETYSLCTTIGSTTTTKYQTVVVSQKKKKKRGGYYIWLSRSPPHLLFHVCVYINLLSVLFFLSAGFSAACTSHDLDFHIWF